MKKFAIALCSLLLLVGCGSDAANNNNASTNENNVEASAEEKFQISDADYDLYNKVMDKIYELSPNGELSDEQVFEKIAPDFGMTAKELGDKMKEIQEAAVNRSMSEYKDSTSKADEAAKDYRAEMQVIAQQYIENQIMHKIKSAAGFTVGVYHYEPYDANGKTYKYTFMVQGQYEEKGTGNLGNFQMILGTNDTEELKNLQADVLEYSNTAE